MVSCFFLCSFPFFLPPSILHPQTPGWEPAYTHRRCSLSPLSQERRDWDAGQAEAGLEVSSLLSMREGGHQRGDARCVTSLVQASLGRAPPLPKSAWTSGLSVSCSQV